MAVTDATAMQGRLWTYYGSLSIAILGLFLIVAGIVKQPIVYPLFVLPILADQIRNLIISPKRRKLYALIVGTLGFALSVMFLLIIRG
ncbi:MAG TPA: hypothetical protein VGA05_03460 [Candidatus Bathyarchaeia archaeon]